MIKFAFAYGYLILSYLILPYINYGYLTLVKGTVGRWVGG